MHWESVEEMGENGSKRMDSGAKLPGFASQLYHLELCDVGQAT